MGANDFRPVDLLEATSRENLGDYSSSIGSTTVVQDGNQNANPNLQSNGSSTSTSSVPINTVKIFIEQELVNTLSLVSEYPKANGTLDTESFYKSNDLLCEGPIEGLVDQDGNTLNYINLNSSVKDRNSSLAYGVYYNDISVKDKKTNLLNLTAANFNISLGNEVNNFNDISSSVYTYDSKVYDLDQDPGIAGFSSLVTKYIGEQFSNSTETSLYKSLIFLKNKARNFSHYVKNKYITNATVNIKIDSCFYIGGKGDTYGNNIRFIVCVTNLTERVTTYFYFQGFFAVKGNAVILPIQIEFNRATNLSSTPPEYLINVYSVEKRITASGERNGSNSARSFSVDSIVEKVNYAFSYPYSVVCQNIVSAKHFSNIPVRSFDCKLLKIKVPNNYDPDAREYNGDWNGDFSKLLRWTDNPAWIFYDLCINSRYGLAKSSMSESDLNKWELYKISKYCDELVVTNAATKYKEDSFTYNNNLSINQIDYNTISFDSTEDINTLRTRYPEKSILYIYDVKNELNESININFKKIILSVTKTGNTVKIKLCNDFGVRKFIESDTSGRFYDSLKRYIAGDPSVLNTEDNAKSYAISYLANIANPVNNQFNSSAEPLSISYRDKKIFDSSLKIASGKCVAKHPEYDDFLEPRFSANIYINDSTEGLKILTDLSSVFRGIFYFKNGLLNLNSDVQKPTSYVFTNSNVKDGFFNYTSSNLESSFSVAKVSYLDKKDNFKDKVVYVEDANLIKKYGLIEKEILGFGITSKYQAERIGKWFLTTGKLESQTVSFSTGIEATLLKIGDIIRVADNLKNSKLEFGKITSLDFKNNYIYIDREMKNDVLGKRIKVLSIIGDENLESTLSIFEASNSDLRLTLLPFDYFSWNLKNKMTFSNNGRTLSSDFVSAAAWDKKAFTKQSYEENCLLSFKVEYPTSILVCGLSSKNILTDDYSDIEYGFYINSGNLLGIIGNDNPFSSPFNFNKTITSSDLLSISYDGNNIVFYLNGKQLTDPVNRTKGNPFLAVVAFNTQFTRITEVNFSRYPLPSYGSFSNLRADANFSIYLEDNAEQEDLYRVIGINESSINEYGITALKYSAEKFEVIDKNEFVDENQYNKKQIIFATDDYIQPAFSDIVISNNIKQFPLSYVQANNIIFDYSFNIESEVLTDSFNLANYLSIEINFITLFSLLADSPYVYGLYCTIIKDGKVLKFKQLKNNASKVTVFLGENTSLQTNSGISFDIDLYAFDSNMRLINV